MKKRSIWFLFGILTLGVVIKLITGYQMSLKGGGFTVSVGNIMLSYDLMPTYLERIETSENFTLIDHEQGSYEDVLTIDYNALPYARGTIIVHISKDSDAFVEPMTYYVQWSNLDYDDISERLKTEEDLYMPILGLIWNSQSSCNLIQIPNLYARGNTIEECRVHMEYFMTDFAQIFTK